MPELPEVETVMRGLAARLCGRTITHAEVRRADLRWALPPYLAARLTGARVLDLRRRGKYFFIRLDGGDSLLVHLGMSGRMSVSPAAEPHRMPAAEPQKIHAAEPHGMPAAEPQKIHPAEPHQQFAAEAHEPPAPVAHEHLVLRTDDGWRVSFVDPRRFGCMDLVPTAGEDSHRLLAGMGPEPLDPAFTPAVLSAALAGKRTPIKAALLDQGVVAGLGNIYVCEALFAARISPRRLAASVAGARAARLVPAIKATLTAAIAVGGSSLRDYRQPSGELGYFQHAWQVYGREGERCAACPGCAGISRIVQSGRSTFYCARLQR
jgi:formamidopyrimidine-DNA glycosylase